MTRVIASPARIGHGDIVTTILLDDLASDFGIAPENLLLMDVMKSDGGSGSADVAALVAALDRMVSARASVVNMSLAGPDNPALRLAVARTQQRNIVIVAAVGNAGPAAPPAYPAAYDGVVGVAAVDAAGKSYIYSGRGPQVDIAAVGVMTSPTTTGKSVVGTSYAAPHVTALIAAQKWPSDAVDSLLQQHAADAGAPGRDNIFGVGILKASQQATTVAKQ